MRGPHLPGLGALLALPAGCVASLHPIREPADLVFDPALPGAGQGAEEEKRVLTGAPNKA